MDDGLPDDVGLVRNNRNGQEVVVVNLESDDDDDDDEGLVPELPQVDAPEPEMIDLTGEDDDDDLQIIEPADPESDHEMVESEDEDDNDNEDDEDIHDEFFGNDNEQEAVAAQQRANQQRMEEEERRQQLDDRMSEDEADAKTAEEKREFRKNGIEDLLNWFIRLKPEHVTNFESAGSNYEETFVSDDLFLSVDICKKVAQDYKKNGSLEGLAEKWELANNDLLIVAICIGVLDDGNQLDIDFTTLCVDRIDEWSMKKCAIFFDKQKKGNKMTPLKFMQFTATTPAFATLLLTIASIQDSGYPCNFVPEDDYVDEHIMHIDEHQLTNEVIATAVKYWNDEKQKGQAPTPLSRAVDDLFHEIEATSTEIKEHHDSLINRRNAFFELKARPPAGNINANDNEQIQKYLASQDRQQLVRARAAHESLVAEMKEFRKKMKEHYYKQSDLAKKLVMSSGEYCLARRIESDEHELTFAIVQKKISSTSYSVKFVTTNEERPCHIRDLAMVNFMIHESLLDPDGEVGLRVAVYTKEHNQKGQKMAWMTGTIAGRRTTHRNDLLVFLDNGYEIYVNTPMKPGDNDYNVVATKKRNLVYQEVITKMNAAKIAVMVGQPLEKDGKFHRYHAHLFIRQAVRAHFVGDYLKSYPEWPLFKTPALSPLNILGPTLTERSKRPATVMFTDRAFAVVRYRGEQKEKGFGCRIYPCNEEGHEHDEERIWRGSHRIEGTQAMKRMLQSNNNLSGRRKHQIAAQFEPSEVARTMPQRNGSLQEFAKRTPAIQPATPAKKSVMSKREIDIRKEKERKIIKTIVKTPVLPELKDLPYHTDCGPDCLRKMDDDPYNERFYKNSPVHTPLLCGWRRTKYTMGTGKKRCNHKKVIVYFAPCGRPHHEMSTIAQYLRDTRSRLTIDCFSFEGDLDTETYVTVDKSYVRSEDLALGIEGIPIPVVNSVDDELAPMLQYCKRRFPYDNTVELPTISREFCTGCSCEGDCQNSLTCECQQLAAQDVANLPHSLQFDDNNKLIPNYSFRNLPSKVITGLYECNDQCACNRNSCHNRVVQNNIKFPLHIFKTAQSGYGCRALTDIPTGAFICTYVGALLTNNIADALQNDDQYFADLDLQDCVLIAKNQVDNETDAGYGGEEDEDFVDDGSQYDSGDEDKPDLLNDGPSTSTRRSTRQKKKPKQRSGSNAPKPPKEVKNTEEEQLFKWEEYFENPLFVVDAKVRGNLGRFLNHSCDPNVQVQHVLYDTHDLRLPWVAFFTTKIVRAGEELSWDYRYDENTEEDVRIECHCGKSNCRGRLL